MNVKKSVFNRILLFSVIPIFILFIISTAVLMYQFSEIKDKNIKTYTDRLEHNADIIEKSIEEIIDSIDFLCFNENVFRALTVERKTEYISDSYVLKNILTEYKNSNDLIESVGIYFKSNGYVVSNTGRSSVDEYIKNKLNGSEYNMSEIIKESIPLSGYRILGPIKAAKGSDGYVIPILVGAAKNVKTVNLLIVTVKCDKLANFLSDGQKNKNTVFIMAEEKNRTEYFSGELPTDDEKKKDLIIKSVIAGKRFDGIYKGKKYIGISVKPEKYVTNYFSYGIMMPINMVLYDFYVSVLIIFLFMLFFMLIDIWVCYCFSKSLYAPIGKMTNYIGSAGYLENKEISKNEFDVISECIKNTIEKNQKMNDKIISNLSILRENYLYKFLISGRLTSEDEISGLLLKNGISFEFDDYVTAIVRLRPTESFYDAFMKNEYSVIINGIDLILKDMIAEENEYVSFVIHPDDEHFVVIVNANEKEMRKSLFERFEKFVNNFYHDREFVKIFVGIGESHAGFNGMKKSYAEVKSALLSILALKESTVLMFSNDKMRNVGYIYTIENENKIYNYLLKGSYTDVENAVSEIMKKNLENGINDKGQKLLYNQFYNTAVKVLGAKGVTESELMGEKLLDYSAENSQDNEQFIDYVGEMLRRTAEYTSSSKTNVDIDGIKKYIDGHFAEELYLDKIADIFGVSSKYLSRLIKEQIGINFIQYVMSVRIFKASEMLKNTSMTVNEIMEKTGFNSRNTFIRVFKKFEGLTPSEYKKINNKRNDINE